MNDKNKLSILICWVVVVLAVVLFAIGYWLFKLWTTLLNGNPDGLAGVATIVSILIIILVVLTIIVFSRKDNKDTEK